MLCYYHSRQEIERYRYHKAPTFCSFFCHYSCSSSNSSLWLNTRLVLSFLNFIWVELHGMYSFCLWLLFLNIIFMRFICIACSNSFVHVHSLVVVYYNLLIYFIDDGHLEFSSLGLLQIMLLFYITVLLVHYSWVYYTFVCISVG